MRKSFLTLGAAIAALSLVAPATAMAADADRLAGTTRYETAIKVADAFGTATKVYVSRGDNQADAVAGGTLKDGPLLLVNSDSGVRESVAAEIKKLGATDVVVLGGEAAVSTTTVDAIKGTAKVTRIAGDSRYDTAAAVSKALFPEGKTSAKVYLANGMTLVDALVGGTLNDGAPILLTNGTGTLPTATVAEIKRLKPTDVVALGGAKAVLPEELTAAANVNGTGGGLSQADATAKAQADNSKAAREAELQVKGWYTVSGKTLDEFLASKAATLAPLAAIADQTAKDDYAKAKAALALTFPKVLPKDVKTDEDTEAIFGVDGAAAVGTAKAATNAATDKTDAKTYKGLQKISEAANAAETAAQTAASGKADGSAEDNAYKDAQLAAAKAKSALLEAEKVLAEATAKATAVPTTEQVQSYMGAAGAKTSRIAGDTRYLTALEIAKIAFPSGSNAKAVYAANGMASADATVAGFIDNKAELAGPVLLVEKSKMDPAVESYLKSARANNAALAGKFKALGGMAVIDDTLVDTIKGLLK